MKLKGILLFVMIVAITVVKGFSDITLHQILNIRSNDSESTKNLKTFIKGEKARIDIVEDDLSAIIKLSENTIFILTHNTKTAMKLPSSFFNTILPNIPKSEKISFQQTGEKKNINGYNCEAYKMISATTNSPDVVWWLSQDLNSSETEMFRKYFSAVFGLSEEATKELKGILVKSICTFHTPSKTSILTMEVKSIDKEKIEPTIFEIPSNYQIIDIGNAPLSASTSNNNADVEKKEDKAK